MIIYNIRANGPWEYDKFILNVTQLYNETKALDEDRIFDKIIKENEKLDKMISEFTDESSITNKIILQDLKERGKTIGY